MAEGEAEGDALLAAPENASTLSPQEARALFRLNKYYGSTTGFCAGYLQTNVAVLPKSLATDFRDFCRKNHAALPLVYCSLPGEVTTTIATVETDIRYVTWRVSLRSLYIQHIAFPPGVIYRGTVCTVTVVWSKILLTYWALPGMIAPRSTLVAASHSRVPSSRPD